MMSHANQRATYLENHPHMGDGRAAEIMETALPAFKAAVTQALAACRSDEACDMLAKLLDDDIPELNIWINKCREEGEISLKAAAE